LALALYDEVTAFTTPSGVSMEIEGNGAGDLPADEGNLVVHSMRVAFDALGVPQPGLKVRCINRIPHGVGLGSSAAAIVAGVTAALTLTDLAKGGGGDADRVAVLRLAATIEGHPDNVAAAVFGGFTVAWQDAGVTSAVRAEPFAGLRPVVFIPEKTRQSTVAARAALPEFVPHGDAAYSAGRAALLALALTGGVRGGSGRGYALLSATEDCLHQPYRLGAQPAAAELVDRLRRAGIAAVLSGSGPTVMALATSAEQEAEAVAAGVASEGLSAVRLALDCAGVRVEAV
jgi:homoserine kinase